MADRNRQKINNLLGGHGLATMDDPRGMVQQLGFLVRDHDHFRQLLVKCEPEQRTAMYESLKPYLRFPAKPLEDYIIAAKQDAEARQLPVLGEDGMLHPFQVGEIQSADYRSAAQDAVNAAGAKGSLELVCRKCTKSRVFPGMNRGDAIHAARLAGWTYGLDKEAKGRELCPDCDKPTLSREDFRLVTEFKSQPKATLQRYMACPAASWTAADWDAHALTAARQWAADGKPVVAVN